MVLVSSLARITALTWLNGGVSWAAISIVPWPQFKDEFDSAMQDMWALKEPASSVLATIQTRTQSFLDRAAEQRARRAPERST